MKVITAAAVLALSMGSQALAQGTLKPSKGTWGASPAAASKPYQQTRPPLTFGAPPATPPAANKPKAYTPGPAFKPYGGYAKGGEYGTPRPPGLINPNDKAYHPYAD